VATDLQKVCNFYVMAVAWNLCLPHGFLFFSRNQMKHWKCGAEFVMKIGPELTYKYGMKCCL